MATTHAPAAPTPGPSRALYFGNLSLNATYYDVCKLANQYGGLELVKIVPQKKCAFVNFINQADAERLHSDASEGGVELCEQKAIIGWAKSTPMRPEIQKGIEEGATRNLFVAGIGSASEHILSSVFLRFGDIENIVCMPKKGFGFVNMCSVKTAMDAKNAAETTGIDIGGRRLAVKFAKEGVNARDPRTVARQPGPFQMPNPSFAHRQASPQMQQMQQQQRFMQHGGMPAMGMSGAGSRAIYVGNLPEEAENRDLCRLGNRFGVLELVRINKEKKNGFINFIDPMAAEALFMSAQQRPIQIHNTPIRIGWAKSGPIRPEIQEAIAHGATRNLYIGGVSENIDESQLKELIAPYCNNEFDGIHILRPKKIAFVNLISVKAAVTARNALQSSDPPVMLDGMPIKVNFAKETIGGRMGGGQQSQRRTQEYGNGAPAQQMQQAYGQPVGQYGEQQQFDGQRGGYEQQQYDQSQGGFEGQPMDQQYDGMQQSW